ncbi:MAG: methyltransferase domain-containing protein [Candidatus Sulfotelmatobacter sp.]
MHMIRMPDAVRESEPLGAETGPEPVDQEGATIAPSHEDIEENPWGYAKRFRFVRKSITTEYSGRPSGSIRVLDVGCGNGSFIAIPLARCGFDVTGIDFHRPSIERARGLASALPNSRFLQTTVTGLVAPLFDVIILSEVLEHVSDPETLLRNSLTHLKPQGIMLVTLPNGYGEFEIDWWIFRTFRLQQGIDLIRRLRGRNRLRPAAADHGDLAATDNADCGHVQFFRRGRLRGLFQRCSLSIAEESAGVFISGAIVCYTLARFRSFIEWNTRVADRLPLALVSSWYFVLRRAGR